MLKIYVLNDDALVYEYDALKDITITKTEIRVEVGMAGSFSQNGLKNLLLSNDFGALDASKPFMPFGPQPSTGNRLVIGSKELFSKKNIDIRLNLEWKDKPTESVDISYANLPDGQWPNISIKNLESGVWNTLKSYDEIFANSSTKQVSVSGSALNNSITFYSNPYIDYNTGTNNGFIALQLTQSFGHKEYIKDYANYLIEKSLKTLNPADKEPPVEPYTPLLQSLYAAYSAYSVVNVLDTNSFINRDIQLFHIYPFGEAEQHKFLQPTHDVFLLPQFKHQSDGLVQNHIGELYIGIENLNPGDAVNILFQVMEGTTNPTVSKPNKHIQWSWLSNNEWNEYKEEEIGDNTLQLVQSGIISFPIPKKATTTNTVLPSGYIWIKAAVVEAAEAVCKLIAVKAQAAVATFVDNKNADDFLNKALPASTISKLKNPDAAIKKINQPFPSFGGKGKESDEHFYIRVSESLRHKGRAINVWDYEHIILEAFPEIYKVKCLNHTQVDDGIYNEVKPGYVSIITIPSLINRNDADPLKPYTQQSTLTNIENYLRSRISCFVNLKACQPQFETVRMEFSLKLYSQYKDFNFYSKKLKEEITQFLSPWAFGGTNTIDFGGKIYKSVLINFIEERYYVDYITEVKMYVKVDDLILESGDIDVVEASTGRSILVSAPVSKHIIHPIDASVDSDLIACEKKNIKRNINK